MHAAASSILRVKASEPCKIGVSFCLSCVRAGPYSCSTIKNVLFLLGLVLGALGGLGAAAMEMVNGQVLQGILTVVVLPFALVIYLILGRMWTELIIVMFRIAENITEINRKTRG